VLSVYHDVFMVVVVAVDDPRADDVQVLLERHLAFAHQMTPREGVHALDVAALLDPTVTFFAARGDGLLLGVGALKELDDSHAEVKSMHTVAEARGQGVGRAVVEHLLAVAAERGYRRVSLETGIMDAFAPARSLYANTGFRPCSRFGPYETSPTSACMSIELDASRDS
jgi:putative acetyltransferase